MAYMTCSIFHIHEGLISVCVVSSSFILHSLAFKLLLQRGFSLKQKQKSFLWQHTAHGIRKGNEAIIWQSRMLNKRISMCYVLGNVHDINDDQEGQVPSLEMPCSSAEFHYTEQRQSHCATAAQHWPFRTHHPEEMPISNIYWHGSILMCRCQLTVGECHRAVNTDVFWYVLIFSHFLSWENRFPLCSQI